MNAAPDTGLIHFDTARRALEQASQIDEVKRIRDQAEALRQYLRQQRESLEMQNQCAVIKLRAERRAGEMLREMPKQHGARPMDTASHPETPSVQTYSDLGIDHNQAHRWQREAAIPEPVFERYIAETIAAGEEVTQAGLLRTAEDAHTLRVVHSSESDEWYTPRSLLERVAFALEGIDLDPCSNSRQEPNVNAAQHFTREDDGLALPWQGRVFINPPYSAVLDWTMKLKTEWDAGRVSEAIYLVPARVDTRWFRILRDQPICFLSSRLQFVGAEGSAPFPSALFYFGPRLERFRAAFSDAGDVYRRIREDE